MTDTTSERLRSLAPLIGSWRIEGPGTSGTVRYAWADFCGPDSPAKFVGAFDEGFNRNVGAWSWPGGGHDSTMIKELDGDT